MHAEYIVSERMGRWIVRRGSTSPLDLPSKAAAIRAAEALAQSNAQNGDTAVVKIVGDGVVEEGRTFMPEGLKGHPRVRFEPERDAGSSAHS